MDFDKSRVYSAVNADELKVGSKVILADSIKILKRKVQSNDCDILKEVNDESFLSRFRNQEENADYILAYLVSEPEEKKLKWTDLKIGDVIRKKDGCIEGMVICIHKDINDRDRRIFCGVRLSDEELEEWEKVEE